MTIGCAICREGEPGWQCHEHPGKAFQYDGCGSEGMACACNPTGMLQWREVIADADELRVDEPAPRPS